MKKYEPFKVVKFNAENSEDTLKEIGKQTKTTTRKLFSEYYKK